MQLFLIVKDYAAVDSAIDLEQLGGRDIEVGQLIEEYSWLVVKLSNGKEQCIMTLIDRFRVNDLDDFNDWYEAKYEFTYGISPW